MSHLDPERLALVAVGQSLTDAEQEHLATCDACSLELAELEHTVAVGRSTVALGELETPPERVWERILDEVRSQPAAAASAVEDDVTVVPPPPVTKEPPEPRRGRRGGRMLFALAASIAAVLAVVGVWNLVRAPESVEIASATLAAFPAHPNAMGTAEVTELADGERTITVSLDDVDESDGFREVWLITADASDLVSLGELDGRKGTFVVPADVDLRDYVLVDVSQEPLDGDPTHSGDSIVRGQLDFS
ncbi:anti-sigma factor [Microbacterium sp. LWH7-1.2]|uniref:anti-sigma factor n=1 Tax=Microbacterium sp. LWH7-1.2 TaxID=3135257 RepID=UPI003139D327